MRFLTQLLCLLLLAAGGGWYIRDDLVYVYRLCEKYTDRPTALHLSAYRAVIQARRLSGVAGRLSGLTWSGKHGLLFAVVNSPSRLVWLTTGGEMKGSMLLPGIRDAGAVSRAGGDTFLVGSQADSTVYTLDVNTQDRHVTVRPGRVIFPTFRKP